MTAASGHGVMRAGSLGSVYVLGDTLAEARRPWLARLLEAVRRR